MRQLVYARITERTVADQLFAVTEKIEALYNKQEPAVLAAENEPAATRKLRAGAHRRMLGNGYCARPIELDCHFESVCESCRLFVTFIEFRPTLERQRANAQSKAQCGLIERLDNTDT